ncbi:redoxin domain-containing protein [Marinifilum sp. N1E240]|uniref:TlpA disulfide reductase family protein n=1 Tax=Marinifilum sp. N1E240 TaxID=2608082 RepID=UPI00128B968F|nr:TlpA disulfide reductase family protein [Marinifilum sp. N1E240]MPQ45603.1 redoxin domain-containing protein [Marinifilum sp. N1E240]
MRKLLFALPLLLFWACNQKDTVKFEGKIDNADGKILYLDKLNIGSTQVLDSVTLDDEGNFKFKVENTKPEFYLLRLSNGKLITLLAEANETILLHSSSEDMGKKYIVEGSKGSKLVKEINDKLNDTKEKLASIRKEMEEKKNDADFSTVSQNLVADYVKALQEQREFSIDFIMKNATSLSSYMALYQKIDKNTFTLNENKDIQFVRIVASSMKALYPEHEYTKAILANLKELQKRMDNIKVQQLIQEKGSDFPEINLPDTNGKNRKLSSLKGKFIILSYWASQDAVSRKQNETLKKIYKKYKNKGLTIYQVSVDDDEKLWKKAIQEDQLNWINVCDPETASSSAVRLYNIQRVPANYLIDQRGEIVGKDLLGSRLEEKVAEYVK